MSSDDDPVTPPPLRVFDKDGEHVSKLDVLLEYVRGLYTQYGVLIERLRQGDQKFARLEEELDGLRAKLGRKARPEPHWLLRAGAIAVIGALMTVMVNFALSGGMVKGVHP